MINSVIASYYLSEFKSELDNACKKMKVDYELNIGNKHVIGRVDMNAGDTNPFSNKRDIYGYDVEIIIPEIDKMTETGYTYLGCIKDDGLVSVHPNDNTDFDLSSMDQIKTFPCNRCGKKTTRNIIHVFRKDDTQAITVYGSSCAKTKFGIDVNILIAKFTKIKEHFGFSEFDENDFFGSERGWTLITADIFCTLAYHEVVEHGYISASKVFNEGYGTCTTDLVVSDYFELVNGNKTVIKGFNYNLKNIDFDYDNFLIWVADYIYNLEDGDFKFNIKGAFEFVVDGYVHPRTKGFVTYMVFKFWFDTVKASENKEVEYNTDYSDMEIKERLRDIKMVVINEHSFEGTYGVTTIYTFRGVDNNIKYKWFASKQIDTVGELIVTGTVKSFEDDVKYGKAVILTRCAVKYPKNDFN